MNELERLLRELAESTPELTATTNIINTSCDIAKAMILCSCVAYDKIEETNNVTAEILMGMTDFISSEMHQLRFSNPPSKEKALDAYFKKVLFETRSRAERRLQ